MMQRPTAYFPRFNLDDFMNLSSADISKLQSKISLEDDFKPQKGNEEEKAAFGSTKNEKRNDWRDIFNKMSKISSIISENSKVVSQVNNK